MGAHVMADGVCRLPHRHQPERERRAAPNLLICRGDLADLERCLTGEDRFRDGKRTHVPGLAELHRDLEAVLAAGGRGTSYGAGSSCFDHPLPFVPVVANHRRDIGDILASWVLNHLAERPETGPGSYDPQLTTRWLGNRLDWAARQDWIVDYAAELRMLRGRAFALLDPVRTSRFPVAWCVTPGCGQALVADIVRNDPLLPPLIYCSNDDEDACNAQWPPHRWIELGKAVHKAQEQQQRNGAA
jgi:hypothetical protein